MTPAELMQKRRAIDAGKYDTRDAIERTIEAIMDQDVVQEAPTPGLRRMADLDATSAECIHCQYMMPITRTSNCEGCGRAVCWKCNTFGRCPACHRLKMRKRREYEEA